MMETSRSIHFVKRLWDGGSQGQKSAENPSGAASQKNELRRTMFVLVDLAGVILR